MQEALGWSSLHYACLYRHRELVQYLLTVGLDPMAIDKVCLHVMLAYYSPVAACLEYFETSFCDYLISCTQSGRTCLHRSICEGPVTIVKDLLAQNACRITRVEVCL